jgi:hypothetical protein
MRAKYIQRLTMDLVPKRDVDVTSGATLYCVLFGAEQFIRRGQIGEEPRIIPCWSAAPIRNISTSYVKFCGFGGLQAYIAHRLFSSTTTEQAIRFPEYRDEDFEVVQLRNASLQF